MKQTDLTHAAADNTAIAGYIIVDNNLTVWGSGSTEQAAREDAYYWYVDQTLEDVATADQRAQVDAMHCRPATMMLLIAISRGDHNPIASADWIEWIGGKQDVAAYK